MTTKIETCTDEEMALALALANLLRARRDAFAAWVAYRDGGKSIGAKAFDAMIAARDTTDAAARGAAEQICDLVPKMAAHLAALKAAGVVVFNATAQAENAGTHIPSPISEATDALGVLCDAPAYVEAVQS